MVAQVFFVVGIVIGNLLVIGAVVTCVLLVRLAVRAVTSPAKWVYHQEHSGRRHVYMPLHVMRNNIGRRL